MVYRYTALSLSGLLGSMLQENMVELMALNTCAAILKKNFKLLDILLALPVGTIRV